MNRLLLALGITTGLSTGCGADKDVAGEGPGADTHEEHAEGTDITDVVFTNRSADCADYEGSYFSEVQYLQGAVDFVGSVEITADDESCTVSSNSIPNHDFGGEGSDFRTDPVELEAAVSTPRSPSAAASATPLDLSVDNAIMLNGVKLDLLAAGCYGIGDGELGKEQNGCFDMDIPWRYDPMSPQNNFFGTDTHNAHTQPDGAYHYHGSPEAMFDTTGATESGLIGFAADGFPIYGPYIDDGGDVRAVVSGYTLKEGERVNQDGEGAFPGGSHDGTFRDDYEYTGAGDLDECNGMTRDGSYGYYVTDAFPWVLGCFVGTTDSSFDKQPPGS